ncbi:MAG: hypothetical protein K6G25_02655 [Bacteroidales bacterium]|nr:hypothetical protein [Bacteroidales bacterium]
MKIIVKTLTLLCLFLMAACQKQEPAYKAKLNVKPEAYDLEFDRYEEVLFNLDTADFQQELKRIQDRYKVFIGGDLNNPQAVQYLKDFATDPFSITLYDKVMTAFPDLKEVEPVVEDVMAHFHYYYPDISLPKKAFTCITGVRPDEPPVQIIADNLVISLDWYLNGDELYDQIGMPRYMAVRTHKATLAKDVALCLYMYYLYEQRKQGQIISEMVFYGRRNFFVEAMCPTMADSVVLGYSSSQWQWAVENEGAVWADIVGNRRLYEAGLDTYMMFFGDGPFTQAYSNDAPSRLGEFFGLNITRSYFSNNEISLQDLIHRKDLQEIFQNSGYKPKK